MRRHNRRIMRQRPGRRRAPTAPEPQAAPTPAEIQGVLDSQVLPGLMGMLRDVVPQPRTTAHLSDDARREGMLGYARPKPSSMISHQTLRDIGDKSMINSAIHARRKAGIRAMARKWRGQRHQPGWRIVHVRHFDESFDATRIDGLDERIRRAEKLLERPHPRFAPTFADVVVPLEDDLLTLDRVCLNVIWDNIGSRPLQIAPVDGATIWPCDQWMAGQVKLSADSAQEQIRAHEDLMGSVYSEYGVDLTSVAYVQVDPTNGHQPMAFLGEKDLIVASANKTTRMDRFGYGVSPCEASWVASTLYLLGVGYVREFFTDSYSSMMAAVTGVEINDVITMVDKLRTNHSGMGGHFRTPFLPLPRGADLKFIPTRQSSGQEMQVAEHLHQMVQFVCAHYSEDSSSIGIDARGPGQGGLSEPDRAEEKAVKRSEGLLNDGHFLCESVFTPMVQMLDDELMVIWAGIDDEREQQELELRTRRMDYHQTLNEGRVEEGKDPIDGEWADLPKWAAQQAFSQMQQQKAMEAQQQMGGMPGQPGEEPGGDDQPGPQAPPGMPEGMQFETHDPRAGGDEQGKDQRPGGDDNEDDRDNYPDMRQRPRPDESGKRRGDDPEQEPGETDWRNADDKDEAHKAVALVEIYVE